MNGQNQFLIDFISGGISGALSKTLMNPFDRIKTIL